ncbi:MAG: tRNA lysidine(34) synthetase TilS [Candidatus Moranbacteria bacterium]|nr:tRNA lysidine(34) synthetase TilS [Candidatus Moranbacteria bacterium]
MTTRSKTATANSKEPSLKRKTSSVRVSPAQTDAKDWQPTSYEGRSFLKRVRTRDTDNRLLGSDTSVLIAVSGGPDSVALLHFFLYLRDKLRLRIGIAHVNYRLRGKDSGQDELLVREYASRYDIPFFLARPHRAASSNEETLRDIRYAFFDRIAKKEGFDSIAVAHTADDQVETILIRLLRGTGPEGLTGMRPRKDRVIRPFLSTTKREVLSFLETERIEYREDASNRDLSILRNRIRHELIPLLERDYRPGVSKAIVRLASITARTRSESGDAPISLRMDEVRSDTSSFSRDDYLGLTENGRAETLRSLFRRLSGTGKNPSETFVREADRLIRSESPKIRVFTSKRLSIRVRGDKVSMIRTEHNV